MTENDEGGFELCADEDFDKCVSGFRQALVGFVYEWARAHNLDMMEEEGNQVIRTILTDLAEEMPSAEELQELNEEVKWLRPVAEA